MQHIGVLFVCLGNICRSPMAEAAMRREAERLNLNIAIDSAGTGDWHIGKPPDRRAQAETLRHGIDISGYRARQVHAADFDRFSHIFALDHENLSNLRLIEPGEARASLALLLDVVDGMEGQPVADPYFGDDSGFSTTWDQVNKAAQALAQRFSRFGA